MLIDHFRTLSTWLARNELVLVSDNQCDFCLITSQLSFLSKNFKLFVESFGVLFLKLSCYLLIDHWLPSFSNIKSAKRTLIKDLTDPHCINALDAEEMVTE